MSLPIGTSLPSWIERMLGVQTAPGEGTVWSLEHSWGWAPWITLLFLVFAEVFFVAVYLRENRQSRKPFRMALAQIRLLLVAIVLFMLAQYALALQRTGLPYLVVLLDDSLSMTTVDRYDDALARKLAPRAEAAGFQELSRWNLLRTLLTERNGALPKALGDGYKLRLYYLTGPRPSRSETPDELLAEIESAGALGEATRLGSAVGTLLDDFRGAAPAAIVILSDGINTDGPNLSYAATHARRRGVPLFAVALGDDNPVRDLQLSDLLVDDLVFVGDVVNFEFQLTGSGFDGRQVEIVLREDGKTDALARLEATVAPGGRPQRLRLPYRPDEAGQFRYVVEVQSLDGELDVENNRQQRPVRVSDEKIRVLLVQAYPSFEYRYLANMLDRDAGIELNTVLQSADPEHAEQSESALRGFPVRREDLFRYNVIILADADPTQLSDSMIQNLVDFVGNQAGEEGQGRGGALVFLAGPNFMPMAYRGTPLEPLLPVGLAGAAAADADGTPVEEFTLRPTELGLVSPQMQLGDTPAETRAIWENLPPLAWFVRTPEVKPGALVLAEHPSSPDEQGRRLPLISMHYVGAGKVLFHATDETWRWRWRVGDVFFARYWVQTIRFLSRAKLSQGDRSALLTSDRREYQPAESVQLRLRFAEEHLAPAADDGVTVVLQRKGHKTRRIKLQRSNIARGLFEGRLTRPPIGSYHAWVAVPALDGETPSVDFEVAAPPGEFQRVEMDAAELQRAAHRTMGRFYTFLEADQLPRDLPAGRQVPMETFPPKPLWNTWPVLLLFLCLLIAEWVLRKWGGMV